MGPQTQPVLRPVWQELCDQLPFKRPSSDQHRRPDQKARNTATSRPFATAYACVCMQAPVVACNCPADRGTCSTRMQLLVPARVCTLLGVM